MNLLYVILSCMVLIVWGCVFFGSLCRYSKKRITRYVIFNLLLFLLGIGASQIVSMILY